MVISFIQFFYTKQCRYNKSNATASSCIVRRDGWYGASIRIDQQKCSFLTESPLKNPSSPLDPS